MITVPIPSGPWPSTKALSLYNVLVFKEVTSIALPDALQYLRDKWDPDYPESWVIEGASWLAERGFVELSNGTMTTRFVNGSRPRRVKRAQSDRELQVVA
jgi:hypothetical protein